ncbi:hypothetical protein FOL46_008239 [Perkinsus olseni]|uniref:Uncharacterized protein n=1 Tax=Perkinsus olseni TaxID=32597 RepID=A0A7J6MMQ5_PEROL|nr:hypothetical protein FOL46_008239 [Perkinsus olseni]
MADVVKAAARPSRSERKRPQAAPSADSEVLRYLMSKKRVRRAVALDSEESSPEEREASRLLLLSSIGHALLDSSEQHPTAVKSPRNVPDGFVMPLKPKVSNHQQGQIHTEIPRMTTKYNSTNSRDLVPHELPPEAFGEYPSLEIHNVGLEVSNRPPAPLDGTRQPPSALLHITRDPPAAYDDLFGSSPPSQPSIVHTVIPSNRPKPSARNHSQSPVTVESSETSEDARPSSRFSSTSHQRQQALSSVTSERPREYSGGLAKPAGAQQTIANTVVAAEPRPGKQRDAAAGVEEPVETTAMRENRPSSVGDKPDSPDRVICDSAAEVSHMRPRSPAKGSKSPRRSSHDQLPPDGNNTSDRPTSEEGPEGFGREVKPAAKATSVLDLGGVLESGDDEGVCFGPRPPGDLSPAAMGLIEDYVPGHEVIDLDDSDGEESPAMSVELRDRKSPRVKELTEDEEACLFEDAGGNAKQENAPPPAEADASEGPVEEVIVIDLDGEEDEVAGRLSPRGGAYSVISSMDAADNEVEDLGEAP